MLWVFHPYPKNFLSERHFFKKTNNMAKEFSFSELDSVLSKINPKGSIITGNTFSKIEEYIDTGNYLLNAQLTGSLFGGIPNSRSICFAGESGTGKTFLTLNACREAQKMGYNIIYCDSEAAVDEDIMRNFGINPEKVRYQPVATSSEVRHFVANLCETLRKAKEKGTELPKIMLVLDSLGNLATTKEKTDASSGNEKKDMTKQQDLRSLFRVITTDLAEFKIPFIFTNHTYASIGSYIPGQTISGGGGAIYNASIILQFSKAQLKEDGTNKSGIIVTSKPAKNRFAQPIPIKFHISFLRGMNRFVGLEEYMNWETCGVQRGKLLTEKEFGKKTPSEQADIVKTRFTVTREGGVDEVLYFEGKETARTIAVRHLADTIKPNELFTAKVITQEVLRELDENIIKKTFMLPNINDLSELEDVDIENILEDVD
jgi:RecA/RadA recombinase